ncbi:TIGR03086 family metal-binding protein [Nonomuraea rosea]|uniref:TIGR03086 family metal-binding protein n=1 Tax=Nonomuraea rosea TaxID=638574 RepID=A0ABP6YNK8_9ACTN
MPEIDLESAAHEVVRLLDGVTEDRLDDPTPCADTPVAALLDHLMGLSLAFTWAARKTTPPGGGPGTTAAAQLDPQWRTLLPQRLDELVESWRDPKAWEGTTEAGGVTMPAGQMAVVALDELVLHGWDLARATGQPFTCSLADTAAVLEFTSAAARPEQAAQREGLFGPAVEVADDAPPFDRALGFAGRDPGWTPEAA